MKGFKVIISVAVFVLHLTGQSHGQVRLAIVPETADAAVAADLLTAQFSVSGTLQLLERAEIERVFQEQALSVQGPSMVRFGRILGADGLILLKVEGSGPDRSLRMRLIAVNPGVALTICRFGWPVQDGVEWSRTIVRRVEKLAPKLRVMKKDAVPVSILNFRSTISSDTGRDEEHQLKALAIQRLGGEPSLFILERERMDLLIAERDLQDSDAAFWNGSYLLEGVIDRNGRDPKTITLEARLMPPRGGEAIPISLSSSRTNLAGLANDLAARINSLLKLNSPAPAWDPATEADEYLAESKWALRWALYAEAQTAAEAAWALGNRSAECAAARIKAYVAEIPALFSAAGGIVSDRQQDHHFVRINERPDARHCDTALYALARYFEFSRNAPAGLEELLSRNKENKQKDGSGWYQLGIDCLAAGSRVLQHYQYNPGAQRPVAGKLGELRSRCRETAELIAAVPSVRDGYFIGNRQIDQATVAQSIQSEPNIFASKLTWGSLWQEKPEDCILLYRELMGSRAYCFMHSLLWGRGESPAPDGSGASLRPELPRVAAWTDADRVRTGRVWNEFARELEASTNNWLRMEARAMEFADADETELPNACEHFFELYAQTRCEFGTNGIKWDANSLITARILEGRITPARELLKERYYKEYVPRISTADAKCREMLAAGARRQRFERQRAYLANKTPYDFQEFVSVFQDRDYTRDQAAELLPAVKAYEANLLANLDYESRREVMRANDAARFIETFLEKKIQEALDNSPVQPRPVSLAVPSAANAASTNPGLRAGAAAVPRSANNLTVKKFLAIPTDGLEAGRSSPLTIRAHHWVEGKLLLEFSYDAHEAAPGRPDIQFVNYFGIAMLDPESERWEVIKLPASDANEKNLNYDDSTVFRGHPYVSHSRKIFEWGFDDQHWRDLGINGDRNFRLFNVHGRLYAANAVMVFEILDGGQSTHVLVSIRRRPAANGLDSLDSLGEPVLFGGPNGSLRIWTRGRILTWMGEDWREDSAVSAVSVEPMICPEGVLFRQRNRPASLWFMAEKSAEPELYLWKADQNLVNRSGVSSWSNIHAPEPAGMVWKTPGAFNFPAMPVAEHGSNLFLLQDNSEEQRTVDHQHNVVIDKRIAAVDGYHAALLCFSRGSQEPQLVALNFESDGAWPPVIGTNAESLRSLGAMSPAWMSFSSDRVFFGLEYPKNGRSPINENAAFGCRAGIWMVSIKEIERAAGLR